MQLKNATESPFFRLAHNEQMYVNKAICESFAAMNIQMFARITKLSNTHNAA